MIAYDPKPVEQAPEPVQLLCQLDKMNQTLCSHMQLPSADTLPPWFPRQACVSYMHVFLNILILRSFLLVIISPSVHIQIFYGTHERNNLFPTVA